VGRRSGPGVLRPGPQCSRCSTTPEPVGDAGDGQVMASNAHRSPRRDSFARGSAALPVSWRHTFPHPTHRYPAVCDQQRHRPRPERLVRIGTPRVTAAPSQRRVNATVVSA
jgi:hypothetical protein